MKKQAVLSLSGGMDSSTVLLHLLAKGYEVTALSFDYGQKHNVELERAAELIEYLDRNGHPVKYQRITLQGLVSLLNSNLVKGGDDVPEGHYEEDNMKDTVVPNRNKIFSSIIQAVALSIANEKNTEVSISGNVYFDQWKLIYPEEIRESFNEDVPEELARKGLPTDKRNSYALGLSFSQIISKKAQGSISLDLVQQDGLLSTPFQRIYFSDIVNPITIGNFRFADDIERLPSSRFKVAIGGRLNYYLNEVFVLRSYLRYYQDNWGITSYTASLEVPIKLGDFFTLYPSYRYYTQTKADYFYKANDALSTDAFYTSDYDLSGFNAGEFGFGVSYTDIFTKVKLLGYGLKSINAKASYYNRSSSLSYFMVSGGIKFVQD